MKKWLAPIAWLTLGIIITIVVILVFRSDLHFYLSIKGFAVIAIAITSLLIVSFLVYSAATSPKDDKNPLGLPLGSVRAIISLSIIVFFVLISLAFYFNTPDSDIAKDILKTLGTLVIAVSAFYFGSKATEQGSKIATDAFKNVQEENKTQVKDVPVEIIEDAIKANAATWKADYNATDIKAGKKQTQNTTNNLNCIVFFVKSKDNREGTASIPPIIPYNFQGQDYAIPTDVQLEPLNSKTPATNGTTPVTPEEEVPVEIDLAKKTDSNP